MADPRRVAAALQYQQSQQDPFDAVPVADAPGTVRTPTPSQLTWMDRLNNLSAGLGTGITNQLEGYKQMVTHPVQTAQDIGTAAVTAVKNPSIIVEALKAMGEKAASGSQGLGEVVGENMTLNPRRLAMALTHPNVSELTVYHGTPHRFPATEANPLGEFDASKIGTGEGAQAYGHGLYVAENPSVAKDYAKGVKDDAAIKAINDEMAALAKTMSKDEIRGEYGKYKSDAGREADKRYDELMEKRQSIVDAPGNLYHVDLPDEMIDKMLDWDKPLSEQEIGKTFKLNVSKNPDPLPNEQWVVEIDLNGNKKSVNAFKTKKAAIEYVNSATGEDLYKSLEPYTGPANVSQQMRELGIPGIKYLDAGSRGPTDTGRWKLTYKDGTSKIYDFKPNDDVLEMMGATATPHGTRNFVIFPGEEHNLKILERK